MWIFFIESIYSQHHYAMDVINIVFTNVGDTFHLSLLVL